MKAFGKLVLSALASVLLVACGDDAGGASGQESITEVATLEDALAFFYDSDTYMLMSEGVADMHCRSDEYLADELMLELKESQP